MAEIGLASSNGRKVSTIANGVRTSSLSIQAFPQPSGPVGPDAPPYSESTPTSVNILTKVNLEPCHDHPTSAVRWGTDGRPAFSTTTRSEGIVLSPQSFCVCGFVCAHDPPPRVYGLMHFLFSFC